ncbi:hypothetical protein ACIRJM_22085 [Streptomyces sp. NPDC102405]|uniref:hypothetical protein n=1 Tax=Streptomyces sp. NPDC102405 TaxID=3366170 RepID=UPI0037F72F1C
MNAPTSEPEPRHDWAEDLAHERLVDFTRSHLAAAQRAAAGAEAATVQLGYVQLARDLAAGQTGGPTP